MSVSEKLKKDRDFEAKSLVSITKTRCGDCRLLSENLCPRGNVESLVVEYLFFAEKCPLFQSKNLGRRPT